MASLPWRRRPSFLLSPASVWQEKVVLPCLSTYLFLNLYSWSKGPTSPEERVFISTFKNQKFVFNHAKTTTTTKPPPISCNWLMAEEGLEYVCLNTVFFLWNHTIDSENSLGTRVLGNPITIWLYCFVTVKLWTSLSGRNQESHKTSQQITS